MNVEFSKLFIKQVQKLKNKQLKEDIAQCIIQVENAENIQKIKNIKKLTGHDIYYRIRVGDYRIGVKIQKNIVEFAIFEHRKDIYKNFP